MMETGNQNSGNSAKLRPQLSKIPGGGIMPVIKSDENIKDVEKLSRLELLDTKQRIMQLLNKKNRLRLRDGGERLQILYNKIINELERRASVEEAAKLFSKLNLAVEGERILNRMEWHGKLTGDDDDPIDDVLDSDDEKDMNPLRIIAQKRMHERRIRILPPETSLITEEDLKEIESFNDSLESSKESDESTDSNSAEVNAEIIAIDIKDKLANIKPKLESIQKMNTNDANNNNKISNECNLNKIDFEAHVDYIVQKTEDQLPRKEKFLPHKTTVSNVHDPKKERLRKTGKHWEITAATPPAIQHDSARLLTLKESIQIQMEYLNKLKVLQEKQAAERLAAKLQSSSVNYKINLPNEQIAKTHPSYTTYRNPISDAIDISHIEGLNSHKEYEEIHENLDAESTSAVNYPIFD